MKKVFKYFMLAAASVAALASCNKAQEIDVPEDVVLTFTSEKPALLDAGTRTVYNPESGSIDWSAGDQIKVAVTVNGTWMAAEGAPEEGKSAKFYLSNGLAEGGQTGVFRVSDSFKLTTAGTYKFYGLYPAGLSSSNDIPSAPSVSIRIPETQTPLVGSFDSSADVLYAVSDDYQGIPQNRNVDLTWTRAVAHGDITLKKLPEFAAGETVQSIQFSIQEGGDLVGSHYINLTTGAVSLPNNGTAVNTVTVDLKNVSVNTTDNTLEFWISTLPFTATSIKVVLTTNKKVYTKEYTGISKEFKANYRNLLGISMKGAAEEAKTQLIPNGEYVISSDANQAMMGVGSESNYRSALDLDLDTPADEAIWTITYVEASDAYRIYNADAGKYLFGYTGDENYLEMHDASFSSSNYTDLFTIELSASEGAYVITPMGNTVRKVGYNKNQPRFALYKGGDYQPVDLNLHSVSFDTTPRIEVVEAEITLPKTAITEARVINTIKRKYFDGAITVSSSADWLSVQNLAAGATDIMATVEANPGDARTATVTLSADGITSQTFTVTQAKNVAQATDVIDRPLTGVQSGSSSYSSWSGKTSNSSAVYAGNSAGGNGAIQLRSKNNDSGIVSTTSGGTVKKIVVTWNSNTINERTLDVYGKSTAYTSASDLYNSSTQGTKIGSIVYGSSTELLITEDYEYVGLRSHADPMYIDKIEITWGDATPEAPISWSASEASANITESGIQFTAPTLSNEQNLPVTYESSAPGVATVSEAGVVTPLAEGSTTISAAFAGSDSYKAKTVTYTLTVTDARPVVATPTFSPVAGEVTAGTVVTISTTTEGATIYYTVDGTTPTTASTQGTTVTIDAAKTIKAIAVKAGYKDSEVAMAAYSIPGASTTVSVTIADYASSHSWVDATQYTSLSLDENVTATVSGGGNTGKYYVSGNDWRMYQNETASITVSAVSGKVISSVTFTYTSNKGGVLLNGSATISSGSEVVVNNSSITLSVGNSGTVTNGQVRITAIEVTYK